MKKKILLFSLLLALFIVLPNVKINAASYNYDFYLNAVYSSEGLSYKDTIYYDQIFKGTEYDESANHLFLGARTNFSTPTDLMVDKVNNTIYLLDGASNDNTETEITYKGLEGGTVTEGLKAKIKKNSAIYVLNNEFKVLYSQNVFKITEEVKDKLATFYGISNDATQVTQKQIESSYTIENADHRCPFINILLDSEYVDAVICYSAEGFCIQGKYLYLADTKNSRILRLDTTNEYLCDEVYLTPNDITFYQPLVEEDQTNRDVFQPSKIAVDGDGRVYAISLNTYQGIIEYKSNGEFNRFLGKNLVQKRSWWTFLLTEQQYESLSLNLPSQFTNIILDERNLLYATAKPNSADTNAKEMIKLINTSGKDVLKRNGYVKPDGDVNYARYVKPAVTGSSIFTAIDVNDAKIYSVVDNTRGRIFTYDDEGNLLYISGEQGTLSNNISAPVAISYFENDNQEYVLVLDQLSRSILIYETTEFGKLVNEATRLYLNNDIEESQVTWEKVVKMNSNYELGYVGIGKSILRSANIETDKAKQVAKYKEAMRMFKLGHNAVYYSDAFKQYRNITLKDNFALIMTGFVVIVVAGVTLKFLNKNYQKNLKRKEGGQLDEESLE